MPSQHGMFGAGQGDVEQTQVFGQALVIGLGDQLGGRAQAHLRLAVGIVVMQRQAAAIHRFGRADERQEHQVVFQALGFVDGHHLDQLLVAFQAQDLLFTGLPRQREVFGQVADQGLFAVQFGGGLLQQFAEVQQVGQHPLAIAAGDQGLRQFEVVQQATQHRQHALAAPDRAVAAELHHAAFPTPVRPGSDAQVPAVTGSR